MMFSSNHGGGEDSDSTWDDFSLANGQQRSLSSSPVSAVPTHSTPRRVDRDGWHGDSRQRDGAQLTSTHNRTLPSQPVARGHDSNKGTLPQVSGKQRKRQNVDYTSGNDLSASGQGYKPSFHAKGQEMRVSLRSGDVPGHQGNSTAARQSYEDVDHEMSRPNTSGNPPYDFSKVVPRSQASHNPPAAAIKHPYVSGSSLEQVSSQIFDDEESERRQPQVTVDQTRQTRLTENDHQKQSTRRLKRNLHAPVNEAHPNGPHPSDGEDFHRQYETVEDEGLLEAKGHTGFKWTRHSHQIRRGSARHHPYQEDLQVRLHQDQKPSPAHSHGDGHHGDDQPTRYLSDELEKEHEFFFAKMATVRLTAQPPDPEPYMVGIARRAEKMFERMWREVFAALSIIFIFIITFAVQLLHFLANFFLKKPLVGLLTVIGDHVFKPLLSTLHNCLFQPFLSFGWNLLSGLIHTVSPVINLIMRFIELLTEMLRAFRLVEITHEQKLRQGRSVQTV